MVAIMTQREEQMQSNPIALIAVMGPTGCGKSTFINLVSGSNLAVGEGLESCTAGVQTSPIFDLDGRQVLLIDTPGFDDTNMSDTDVLKLISAYLSSSYEKGYKLTAVIYMHRISDVRVGGVARKNFHMFRKLCGDDSLKNVLVVTTMWAMVPEAKGAEREAQLQTSDLLFKPALDNGATMARHYNTVQSACTILAMLVPKPPQSLQIQRELVDEGKDISQTAAGQGLDRELALLNERHKQEMDDLRKQMAEALAEKDAQTMKEIKALKEELLEKIDSITKDRDRLSRDYQTERARVGAMLTDLETQKKGNADLQRQFQEFQDRKEKAAEAESHRRNEEIRASRKQSGGGGGCSIF